MKYGKHSLSNSLLSEGVTGRTQLESTQLSVLQHNCGRRDTGFRSFHWSDWNYVEATGSDHQAISFRGTVNSRLPALAALLQPFNVQRAKWGVFDTYLTERESSLVQGIKHALSFDDLGSAAEMLASGVLDETSYKSARNRYFRAIREARNAHWETFLQATPDVYKAYHYIRNKRGNQSKIPDISNKDENGEPKVAKLATEKADAFLSTLFDNSEKASLPSDETSRKAQNAMRLSAYEIQIEVKAF